eukprot:403-Chlamydomonas_euryale.AAC.1
MKPVSLLVPPPQKNAPPHTFAMKPVFALASFFRSTLPGLRSPWMIPSECRCCRPDEISRAALSIDRHLARSSLVSLDPPNVPREMADCSVPASHSSCKRDASCVGARASCVEGMSCAPYASCASFAPYMSYALGALCRSYRSVRQVHCDAHARRHMCTCTGACLHATARPHARPPARLHATARSHARSPARSPACAAACPLACALAGPLACARPPACPLSCSPARLHAPACPPARFRARLPTWMRPPARLHTRLPARMRARLPTCMHPPARSLARSPARPPARAPTRLPARLPTRAHHDDVCQVLSCLRSQPQQDIL